MTPIAAPIASHLFAPLTPPAPAQPRQTPAAHSARWKCDNKVQASDWEVARACGITPVLAAILRARGHGSAPQVKAFLSPESAPRDPGQLPDMERAVERLQKSIASREPLLVFGDYDVDGLTSTAMLSRALRDLGANLSWRVPERTEGYGLSVEAVEAAAQSGTKLILTADNGVTAHAAVERARQLDIDVIITDHHEPQGELPHALAVVNPKREDSVYGFRELCGCGVAFKLMQALMQAHYPRYERAFGDKFVEFVALATIADCVPLVDENRTLARDGLARLARTKKVGIKALMDVSRVKLGGESLKGGQVGFALAPRLNAAGRMAEANLGLRLLMSGDEDECRELAGQLETHNRSRQNTTQRILDEALAFIEQRVDLGSETALVVAGRAWGKGIVGLVASRLVENFARPAIVLGMHPDESQGEIAHGSGRSQGDFDLGCVLDATRDLLLSGGGHKNACGVSLLALNLDNFRARVSECAGQQLQLADLVPTVEADCAIGGGDITPELLDDLARLEPCGSGNHEPVLMLREARIVTSRVMGSDKTHVKWVIETDGEMFEAVWWRAVDKQAAMGLGQGSRVDLCFVPEWNVYNGRESVQLKVKDARPATRD